jgi:dTDP-4-dehydrorhamnose reductase
MADVDECYRHPEKSRQVNVNAVVEILSLFKEYGIFPIFFSTDLVFDCKGGLNNESVPTNPSTLYASQKVEVETLIRNSFEKYLILRVSKLMSFSMHPRNIMAQVVHTIRNGTTYNAFTDQWITPVFIEDVAHIVESAIAAELSGIYHLAGKESVTRHDLAMRVCKEFHLDRRYLNPTTLAEKALTEPRGPKNTLSSDKITKALDFRFTPISEGLSKMLEVDKRDRSRRE